MTESQFQASQAIQRAAGHLVAQARQAGLVVTIETVPQLPLSMGNYSIAVNVREARHAPAAPVNAPAQIMPIMRTGKGIPFTVLNEEWAQRNHSQSLARLAERGGLDATEALAIIEKRRWIRMDPTAALAEVERYVRGEPVAPDTGGDGPRAYACFAENGNCIIWSTSQQMVADAAAKHGRPYIPLYGPGAGQVATVAASDVLVERARQINAEGWTPEHDDQHSNGELAAAAGCYALYPKAQRAGMCPAQWPWDSAYWKPTTRRRALEKAGALILAEIERLDRAAAREAS